MNDVINLIHLMFHSSYDDKVKLINFDVFNEIRRRAAIKENI